MRRHFSCSGKDGENTNLKFLKKVTTYITLKSLVGRTETGLPGTVGPRRDEETPNPESSG